MRLDLYAECPECDRGPYGVAGTYVTWDAEVDGNEVVAAHGSCGHEHPQPQELEEGYRRIRRHERELAEDLANGV